MKNNTIFEIISIEIEKTYEKFDIKYDILQNKQIIEMIYNDLYNFSKRDPSAGNDLEYVFYNYLSFKAVFYYRISNNLYYNIKNKKIAKLYSEIAKGETGIEIHPAAKIGKNFILDHGKGTVIGETVTIGDDCYFLQNIILGSSKIADNKSEIRHPQIGNNVEIGGNVNIFGNIKIGNNVKISPNAVIKKNIPDNTRVIVNTINQIVKTEGDQIPKYTGYQKKGSLINLYFQGCDIRNLGIIILANKDIPIIDNMIYNNKISINFDKHISQVEDIKVILANGSTYHIFIDK